MNKIDILEFLMPTNILCGDKTDVNVKVYIGFSEISVSTKLSALKRMVDHMKWKMNKKFGELLSLFSFLVSVKYM